MNRMWPILAYGLCVGVLATLSQQIPNALASGALWGTFAGIFALPVANLSFSNQDEQQG